MAAFVVGQIVRPKRLHTRRDGTLQDWKGLKSAQGWVEVDLGVTPTVSATHFNPATSISGTTAANEQSYAVTVWDVDAQAWVALGEYPESALDPASLAGTAIAATFVDPTGGTADAARSANVCRSRE